MTVQVLKVLGPSTGSSSVLDYQTQVLAHWKWFEQVYVQYRGIAWFHHQVDLKVRVDLEEGEGLDGIEIVANDPVVGLALIDSAGWSWN